MTTMFVQLRGVVYLLIILQCCVCVVSAEVTEEDGKDYVNFMNRWIANVERELPGAKSCKTVGEKHNADYKEQAENALKLATEMVNMSNRTKYLMGIHKNKTANDEGINVKEELVKQMGALQKKVEESRDIVTKARATLEEARELAGCKTILHNLEFLMTDRQEENLNVSLGELEKLNKAVDSHDWRVLINRTRSRENETKWLIQGLKVVTKRSTGYSVDVAKGLGDAAAAVERAVEWFKAVESEVGIDQYAEKVRELETKTEQAKWREKLDEPDKEADIVKGSNETTTKELKWTKKKEAGDRAVTVTGAKVREYTGKTGLGDYVDLMNQELEKERKALTQKKNKEERDFEEMKQEEIRRKEEERRAEEKRVRRAKEEKARLEREAAEKKVREEKERRERAEAVKLAEERKKQEKLAEEEKARKAKKEAERAAEEANKAKKKDGSNSPAMKHSPLLLLLLCVMGCTLVC
ncbi:uncharacterized protein TM35_000881060 [Trypanosoma theileri]|uniref:Uncharacterized protein n=1 Tax=Trypanosoma theileri TaxID=67003 RepID=A0A1X0NF76_9TRYP|nr:uncharacterized protein TM35_000881060 [Trypanosoma theileri]ORC82527.1 hypothetical protein TM35_000881060 [Trypanosoma theileri]